MKETIYPAAINRACALLLENDIFINMPDGYIRIIMRIIKKINIAKPHAAIFASRARLASESGKSLCTVHRAIQWLENNGLIQREQTARPNLRGSSSPITPTKLLLSHLGFLTQAPQHGTTTEPTTKPATQGLAITTDSSRSMNLKNDNHSENNLKPENFVRLQKVKIPKDLAWLVETQELRATGVLSLMKLAKQAKQRLSDVVAATKNYLTPHKGRELYAYLRSLLGKDKDYRQLVAEENNALQAQREKEYLERKAIELEGRRFQTRDGQTTLTILRQGFFEEIRQGVRRVGSLTSHVLEAISSGRLVTIGSN